MEKIKEFYTDFGKIIGFMVMTLIIEMAFGQKIEKYWLLLVLLGMVLLNYESFNNFLTSKFDLSKESSIHVNATTHTSSSGKIHGGTGGSF